MQPPLHTCPCTQTSQRFPPLPHICSVSPRSQTPLLQQPTQLDGLQSGAGGGGAEQPTSSHTPRSFRIPRFYLAAMDLRQSTSVQGISR
jgi:hypothetical protein